MSSEELAREAQDPSISAARLQEIAQADRSTWHSIAAHPAAYPGLLDWLGEHGDDSIRAAIAERSVTPPPPPAPPVPPAPPAPPVPPAAVTPEPAPEPVNEPTQQLPVQEAPSEALATSGAADSSNKKSPLIALGIVAVIVAVVAGGYFGVSALTGDDDDDVSDLTSSSQSSDDNTDDSDDVPSGDGDKGSFCATMKELQDSNTDMLTDMSGATDPESLNDIFSKMSDTYDELEKSAPAEVKAEVAEMRKLIDAIASGGVGASAPDNMTDYIDATTKVTTYYYSNCL